MSLLILFLCITNLVGCASSGSVVKKEVSYANGDALNRYAENDFIWPLKGKVITFYGIRDKGTINNGIDIQPIDKESYVLASRQGRVIFVTSPDKIAAKPRRFNEKQLAKLLKYFGHMVILDHGDGFFTLYANNSGILVKEGGLVSQGASIARLGKTSQAKNNCLHFEIRKGAKPLNPFYFLP